MSDDAQQTTAALGMPPAAREIVACWETHAARFDVGGATLVIGRGEGSDIRVPHASVSRSHARLTFGEGGIEIEDLGSANGTSVDGEPAIGRVRVAIGAIIALGVVRIVVRMKARGAALPSPMLEVRKLAEKAAPSNVSLILVGETGAGKEILAEEIHTLSRRTGPLVRLNCAGLAVSLLESELFGHERGAFTGALASKAGLIEAAHGGTLFLDELGEMPEVTQPKLLRVLESGEVRRIGALKARSIDVRFVSATHRDLRTLAVMGKFREDLLFRLNGLTVRIPPLRDRRDEIARLAEIFLEAACARNGRAKPALSEGARVLLESHRWPGNVRELKNLMNRVALLCDEPQIGVQHLVFDPAAPGPASTPAPASMPSMPASASMPPLPRASSSDDDEKQRILDELSKVGGNQAAAARALGITPRVLGYRMDKLGLPRPRRQ